MIYNIEILKQINSDILNLKQLVDFIEIETMF